MIHETYKVWVAATAVILAGGSVSRLAAQPPPPTPVPVTVATLPHPLAQPGPGAPGPPGLAPAYVSPNLYVPYQDTNGPLLVGDPLLDHPAYPPPGFFATFEGQVLFPHIKNRLTAPVAVDGLFTDLVHLPTAELDNTGCPRVELGYRLPQGFGEFSVAYRSVVTEGGGRLIAFDPVSDGLVTSRLNVNTVDLDYGSHQFALGPCWDMQWQVGARLASAFFDSRASGLILEQRTNNNFFGGGPQAALSLWRQLDWPGLALFGRLDGAVPIGRIRQAYEETFFVNGAPFIGGATNQGQTQAVPILGVEAGLSWTMPAAERWVRVTGGYHFERWWYLGNVAGSQAELTLQGLFLRAEISF